MFLTSLHSVVFKPTYFYIAKLLLTCRRSEYIHCSSLLTWSIFILPNPLFELILHVAILLGFFFTTEGIWSLVPGFTLESLRHVLVADKPTSNVYSSMPVLQCENVTSFPNRMSANSTWFKHDTSLLSTLQDLAAGDKHVTDLQLKLLCGYI